VILCQRCRGKIPNPDSEVFDVELQSINSQSVGYSVWAFVMLLLSRSGHFISCEEIAEHIATRGDPLHMVRQCRFQARRLLKGTRWIIETRSAGRWHGAASRIIIRVN